MQNQAGCCNQLDDPDKQVAQNGAFFLSFLRGYTQHCIIFVVVVVVSVERLPLSVTVFVGGHYWRALRGAPASAGLESFKNKKCHLGKTSTLQNAGL